MTNGDDLQRAIDLLLRMADGRQPKRGAVVEAAQLASRDLDRFRRIERAFRDTTDLLDLFDDYDITTDLGSDLQKLVDGLLVRPRKVCGERSPAGMGDVAPCPYPAHHQPCDCEGMGGDR